MRCDIKKAARVFLILITVLYLFGCGNNGNLPDSGGDGITMQDNFPYWNITQQRKTDGQHYTGNGVELPETLWQTPQCERYPELDRDNVKAYFIDSVADTKVFCYVGIPENAGADNKVPAVVLVHGATGTSFYDWVSMWVNRGYAAIAPDTEGRMPTSDASLYNAACVESNKPHGPVNAAFTDSARPLEKHWVYHALSSVIASASFIKSFEGVDGSRLGITGVSYGGFLTCLAAGYDDRFIFAAPVYGCLANTKGTGELGKYIKNAGAYVWDGTEPLENTNAVVFMVNGNTDAHFSLESTMLCAEAASQSALCIKNNFAHGHWQGAEVDEVFAFADEICFNATPLIRITDISLAENGEICFAKHKDVDIKSSAQYYSVTGDVNSESVWGTETAEEDGNGIFFSPMNYKYQYINITDTRGLIVSSPLIVI